MMSPGARAARLLAFVLTVGAVAALGRPSLARAQDLAPAPAAPVPVPEELGGPTVPNSAEAPNLPPPDARTEEPQTTTPEGALPPAVEIPPALAPLEAPVAEGEAGSTNLKYLLQSVEIVGNKNTRRSLIRTFVPIETGASLDVNDPEIEALRYRLLGTGWYDRVELRLKRGSRPGWVVLVIEVEERSTLVFQQLAAGVGWSVEGVNGRTGDNKAPKREPEPYLGLGLAETNFLGTGRTLAGELLVSPDQQGVAFSFFAPGVRQSGWSLRLRTSLVKGREYFGGDERVNVSVDCNRDLSPEELSKCQLSPPVAVVDYWRSGLSVGTARDVGAFTRLSLEWHGDFVKVPPGDLPDAASELRGRTGEASRVPIDFSIEPGRSYVSMLSVGLLYDKRDSAILPSRGTLAAFNGDLASGLIASDYSFMRVQASYNHWFALHWGHTIRTGAFFGALFGEAPFFYKYFITDLTDLLPSRILGLNLDHRPAPNLLGGAFNKRGGTAIGQMRQEELAGRIDAEYVWPLARGRKKFVKGADAYFLFGLYGLADTQDLRVALPGYEGFARLPIDITFDAGVRLDTRIGVFQIGVAKLFWISRQ
jgi:outer membrane protein insertion porin family